MNYYEHHIGDYAEATAHLSFVEDAAYGRLIRKYYAMERNLPPGMHEVKRLIGCRTPQERRATERVLKEFFELREDGWHQSRCDEEIARFKAKSQAARDSAGARWNLKKHANASNPHMRNGSERNATASNPHDIRNAEGMRALNGSHDVRNALQSPVSNPQSEDPTPTPPKGGVVSGRRSPDRILRDAALAAWSAVVKADGATEDPKARDAMRVIGGYSRIRLRTVKDEPQIRREFIDAYRSAT